jgi:hypothetical protein
VVANLHGRPPPEALSRTRFGVVHLWAIDAPQFRLPPAFALHFQDTYPYPPAPVWPPNDQMQNYHKDSLYYLDNGLRNEMELAGVHYGKNGHYVESRGDNGFQKPIIAHILFRLPYELTWTDAKGRNRIFPLQWHSVVKLIIRELKKANKKLAK